MAKTLEELNALENPKSRSELFYNYLVGRNTNLSDLPQPYSRQEEYLEYICYNSNNNQNTYIDIEGSDISTDSNEGYLKNIEIHGNTIQDIDNLKDIKSVGDKVEGQELYKIPILSNNGLLATDENYKEDILTILSPVALEKVGNIEDRIIEKNGVYGVEKNIITERLASYLNWREGKSNSGLKYFFNQSLLSEGVTNRKIICDTLKVVPGDNQNSLTGYNQVVAHQNPKFSNSIYVAVNVNNVEELKKWLEDNPTSIKFATTNEPEFIPLPNDQQIKLKSFANKTNISFLTEIKGTIKAQIAKPLDLVINSLQKRISLLEYNQTNYEITQNRLLLTNRYSTDSVGFNFNTETLSIDENLPQYDNDLYNLILDNIIVGKDNYDRNYMEGLINFYWIDFIISDEMYFTLSSIIEEQYTEQEDIVIEESPNE